MLEKAICVSCGGALEVDKDKDAAICIYCGTPFIIEKAINQYKNTYNVKNDISNSVVNIYHPDNQEHEKEMDNIRHYVKNGKWHDAARRARRMIKNNPKDQRPIVYSMYYELFIDGDEIFLPWIAQIRQWLCEELTLSRLMLYNKALTKEDFVYSRLPKDNETSLVKLMEQTKEKAKACFDIYHKQFDDSIFLVNNYSFALEQAEDWHLDFFQYNDYTASNLYTLLKNAINGEDTEYIKYQKRIADKINELGSINKEDLKDQDVTLYNEMIEKCNNLIQLNDKAHNNKLAFREKFEDALPYIERIQTSYAVLAHYHEIRRLKLLIYRSMKRWSLVRNSSYNKANAQKFLKLVQDNLTGEGLIISKSSLKIQERWTKEFSSEVSGYDLSFSSHFKLDRKKEKEINKLVKMAWKSFNVAIKDFEKYCIVHQDIMK